MGSLFAKFDAGLALDTDQRAGFDIMRAVHRHRCSGRIFAQTDMTACLAQHLPALGLQLLDDVFGFAAEVVATVGSVTPQAAAATLCVDARVVVANANVANSCLLRISNSISDGVSRLGAGEIPSF